MFTNRSSQTLWRSTLLSIFTIITIFSIPHLETKQVTHQATTELSIEGIKPKEINPHPLIQVLALAALIIPMSYHVWRRLHEAPQISRH